MNYEIERDEEYLKTWLPLNAFSKFSSKTQDESTINEIEIIFLGTEEVDIASESQIKALEYIIDNSEKILTELSTFIFSQREELEEVYGQFDKERSEGFPNLNSENEVCRYLDLSTIYIHDKAVEDISYIGLHGNCTWDSEHAFGTVFHKNRIIDFGDWDTAYNFYKEKVPLSISVIYSLDSLSVKRKQIIDLAKNIQLDDINNYLDLFDWLINQRAIYGYRSTKVDLTDKEKVALIISIEYLDISGRKLTELPESINLLKKIRHLNLRVNEFKTIPTSISQLKNLESLDISVNSVSDLPSSFSSLTKLNYLDISMNKFNELPACIKDLKNLKNLDVSDNNIKLIPEWIGQQRKLQDLRISDNKIKKLPKSIKNIESLEILYAMGNRFSFLQRWKIKNWLSNDIRYDIDND